MALPDTAYVQLTPDMRICRLLTGMWQVSGAHGAIDPGAAVDAMSAYHDTGFTTWDMADHYGPAEEFMGEFRRRLTAARGRDAVDGLRAFTKWVPRPGPMSRRVVEEAIGRSLSRLGVEALDLLQFHWWEYGDGRYLDAFAHMSDLVAEGRIRHLALTNFDTKHLDTLLGRGFEVASNQVQYSLIDRRPEVRMAPYCGEHRVPSCWPTGRCAAGCSRNGSWVSPSPAGETCPGPAYKSTSRWWTPGAVGTCFRTCSPSSAE